MLDLVVLTRVMWEKFSLKIPMQLRINLVSTRKNIQGIERDGPKSGFSNTPSSAEYLGRWQG